MSFESFVQTSANN